jgi:chemosensory pili system protein ChpA (sensor histidine kinase/response regulator)
MARAPAITETALASMGEGRFHRAGSAGPAAGAASSKGTRRTIAIVEDDDNVAGLLGLLFEREGFAPLLLRDGRAAQVYVAAHEAPAAVILDVTLPYRDGFAVAGAIRANARWSGVPVVMLTGRSLAADVARARALDIEDYVVKPFDPRALVGLVRRLGATP